MNSNLTPRDNNSPTASDESTAPVKPSQWKTRLLQIAVIIFVLGLTAVIYIYRNVLARFTVLGYLGAFFISLISSASLVLPLPNWLLIAVLGTAFNPWLIGLVAAVGGTIGELTGYGLGYGGRIAVERLPKYEQVVGWMRRWGSPTIFVLALIPNPLFDVAGAVAGVLRFPLWKFMLWGFLGRLPKSIFYAHIAIWFTGLLRFIQ